MNQILDTKEYFCINCFENENIKKFIKDTGEKIKIQYECDFCNFESCDEYDIEECIQEHIDNCMQKVQERETKEDYENYEEAYELRCREECNQKYRKRMFVIKAGQDEKIPITLTGHRTELIKGFSIGQYVEVTFKLRGREWIAGGDEEAKYFLTAEARAIENLDNPYNPLSQPIRKVKLNYSTS